MAEKKKAKKKQKGHDIKLGGLSGKAQDALANRSKKIKDALCKSTGDCK